MNYLAWDPGETTGWASFRGQGAPYGFGRLKYGAELNDFLDNIMAVDFELFIIEEFQLRTKANDGKPLHYTPEWDRVYTARAIGAIERRAHEIGARVHWQYPHQLGPASQAFGLSLTKFRSAQHPVDALLHGLYYAWKELGVLPPERPQTVQETPAKAETAVLPVSSLKDLRKAGKVVERHRKTGRPLR
jgi:hypothetical protein